jgi:hypothetical protein
MVTNAPRPPRSLSGLVGMQLATSLPHLHHHSPEFTPPCPCMHSAPYNRGVDLHCTRWPSTSRCHPYRWRGEYPVFSIPSMKAWIYQGSWECNSSYHGDRHLTTRSMSSPLLDRLDPPHQPRPPASHPRWELPPWEIRWWYPCWWTGPWLGLLPHTWFSVLDCKRNWRKSQRWTLSSHEK